VPVQSPAITADEPSTAGVASAQRGLWLISELYPGNSLYNVFCSVRMLGRLDVPALRYALDAVVARHEALRTTFAAGTDGPVARIAERLDIPLDVTDRPDTAPDSVNEFELREFIRAWSEQPFDLANGPLLRARVVRVGPREHVLCLSLHHIICDGQSMSTLFDELSACYTAKTGAESDSHLAPLAAQYRDYVAWERANGPGEDEISWWRSYLADVPYVLAVPADRPRPAVRGSSGATKLFSLPDQLMTDLTELAGRLRVSPFMVLLGVYATLLGRLSDVTELLIGVPFTHRPLPEFEPLIGLFVKNLPVRCDIAPDQTFEQFLRAVRGSVLGVLAHQEVSFDQLVDELKPDRSPGHTPLVQVAFSADMKPFAEPRLAGLEARIDLPEPTAAKFDLDMSIYSDQGGAVAALTYSTELFDGESIGRLADRFVRLLTTVIASPELPLGALPLTGEAELAEIVGSLAQGGPAQAAESLVHEVFARQAALTPAAPAVSTDGLEFSYAELDLRSSQIGHQLRLLGVGPDQLVGVLVERSIDLMATLLGILKAGAAYLPLSSTHPPAYLAGLLTAAGARHAIASPQLAHRLAEADVSVLTPAELSRAPERSLPPAPPVRPENLAYVLFTSGSTGLPKGVAITHRSLSNVVATMRQMYELTPADRVLQFANIGFDIAVEEMFPTWAAGGCVVLSPEPPPDPAGMTALMNSERVTFTILTSTNWQYWFNHAKSAGVHPAPTLRLISIGAEPVDAQTLRHWQQATGIPVFNAYGLTETTVNTTLEFFADPFTEDQVPIGRPIRGVEVYVLDDELNPVPIGVTGQIYAAGDCLARGYLGQPELTADRFVPHPFSATPGARMLRTGDLARWRTDRTLEAIGRLDKQLKLRGYRIEPGQVEATMCRHPEVGAAVVTIKRGLEGQDHLIGYVVPARGATVPADLRSYLAGQLPAYLVPSALIAIPAIPRNANGKTDPRALPEPTFDRAEHVPASTELERRLVEVWQRVLGLPAVGIHDNFFDLGGTSLLLTTMLQQVNDVLGQQPDSQTLPLVTLYEFPTIASLAGHLSPDERPDGAAATGQDRTAKLQAGRARMARRQRGQGTGRA
jgi:amino acid adenylation domain-containing protein